MQTTSGGSALIHDDPDLLRRSVEYTWEKTKFFPAMIEKDYYCGIVLDYLAKNSAGQIFKGGTCLSKVHLGFNRLSEDLDFVIPMAEGSTRGQRSAQAQEIKRVVGAIPEAIPGFSIIKPLQGANSSMQYMGTLGYASVITGREEKIMIDVSLREPLLKTPEMLPAKTLLLDPDSGVEALSPFPLACMARAEAYAEKFRAALSREEPAIRDYYDVDYAMRNSRIEPFSREMLDLIARKMSIPGTKMIEFNDSIRSALARQIESELWPVIRNQERSAFDLDRSMRLVSEVSGRLMIREVVKETGNDQNPKRDSVNELEELLKKTAKDHGVNFKPDVVEYWRKGVASGEQGIGDIRNVIDSQLKRRERGKGEDQQRNIDSGRGGREMGR